ncbi:hypothetical protein JDV02_000528 [Purpureocillium takamizusanense]|uniref:Uncharacterized protein n=1 Tax=Purpureocillium takamizusanense TaxID=2060973 RepID=A0A9Q8Q514_9HYPO|nr:uncharacterized protein JDV02_000528 [Purpureocillium takamizusanense]UNI13824.1 hypothetical protein JDV02_000528 [Purpureocillium takamizusanense]
MCSTTTLLYTICLHTGTGTRNDSCKTGKCKRRIKLILGWCPQCKMSLSGAFPRPSDPNAPSTIRRYWLWVSRQPSSSSSSSVISGAVTKAIINTVQLSEINHGTRATADKEWAVRMLNTIRGVGAETLELRDKTWTNDGRDSTLSEVVRRAQDETLEWAEGYLLL